MDRNSKTGLPAGNLVDDHGEGGCLVRLAVDIVH
jgi:hypothetical protein